MGRHFGAGASTILGKLCPPFSICCGECGLSQSSWSQRKRDSELTASCSMALPESAGHTHARQGGRSSDGCTSGEALAVPAAPLDWAMGLLGTDVLTRPSAQPLVPGGLGRGGHRQQQHRHCDKPEGLAAGCSPRPNELLLLFIMLCDCPARAQGCLGQTQATALGGGLSSLSLPVSLRSVAVPCNGGSGGSGGGGEGVICPF